MFANLGSKRIWLASVFALGLTGCRAEPLRSHEDPTPSEEDSTPVEEPGAEQEGDETEDVGPPWRCRSVLTARDVEILGLEHEDYDDSVRENAEQGLECVVRNQPGFSSSIALRVEVYPASSYDGWLEKAEPRGGLGPHVWSTRASIGQRTEWRFLNHVHTLTVFFLSDDGRYAVRLTGSIDGPADEPVMTSAARIVLAHLDAR